jgi:cysteine-rich repeat protein
MPFCGDAVIDMGEECDNGNNNGDGFACLSNCVINVCGDSFDGPGEECDDGNLVNGDGCTAACNIEDEPPEVIFCGNKIWECGDALDNDMDGQIDLGDSECTTPCDDDEGSYNTNLPGQNVDCKQDCYWDGDSGSGNDTCEWNLKCDPENPGLGTNCEYDPNFMMCEVMQPQMCLDFCAPLVPNGCDCFGCCEIDMQFVYLGNGNCSLDNLDECQGCTQHPECVNLCDDPCEVCFGQDPEDLPEECNEPECPDMIMSCFDEMDCAPGEFCQTGCCVPIQ